MHRKSEVLAPPALPYVFFMYRIRLGLCALTAVPCFLFLFFLLTLYPNQQGNGFAPSTSSIWRGSVRSRNRDILLAHQYHPEELRWSVLSELTDTIQKLAQRTGHAGSTGPETAKKEANDKEGEVKASLSPKTAVTMWVSDFHITPIADIKELLGAVDGRVEKKRGINRGEKGGNGTEENRLRTKGGAAATVWVHDHSLSGHCHQSNSCADRGVLRHLTRDNGLVLGTCPTELRSAFYEHYAHSKQQAGDTFREVDAFLCLHAASLCELYMPFNRTMIIIASTRYELGRGEEEYMYGHHDSWLDPGFKAQYERLGFDDNEHVQRVNEHYGSRWKTWNQNLRRINGGFLGEHSSCPDEASDAQSWISKISLSTFPKCKQGARRNHVIAANNLYDKYYMQYFTGIRDVLLLPSTAQHVEGIHWSYPKRHAERDGGSGSGFRLPVLLGPSHNVHSTVEKLLQQALLAKKNVTDTENIKNFPKLKQISQLYPGHFEYAELAEHPGIVIIPYQVSIMSFYEFYRMGIPIFLPTARLLTRWHMDYRVLRERSWPMTRNRPQRSSMIPPFAKQYRCGADCTRTTRQLLPELFQHDPNNEFSEAAVGAWVQLSDFYTWPHVILFDSPEELVELLLPRKGLLPSLQTVSQRMVQFLGDVDEGTKLAWSYILEGIAQDKRHRRYTKAQSYPETLNEALQEQYGYQLSAKDCYAEL